MDKTLFSFTLLGRYNSPADLISFNNNLYQPHISISANVMDNQLYNIKLDSNEGFSIVVYKDDEYVLCNNPNLELINATIVTKADEMHTITIGEARDFIVQNYKQFEEENEPYGHRGHPDIFYKIEASRFLNFSNS